MALPKGYVKIGPHELGVGCKALCVVKVTAKAKAKTDKKVSDGDDDATTVFKGKEPADFDLELSWNGDDDAADKAIEDILVQLSTRGANAGKSWTFDFRRARVYAAAAIVVDDVEGPNDVPGTSKCTAKLACSSWAKQQGKGKGKTTTDPSKWKTGHAPIGTVDGFGGNGNTVVIPQKAPTVKP